MKVLPADPKLPPLARLASVLSPSHPWSYRARLSHVLHARSWHYFNACCSAVPVHGTALMDQPDRFGWSWRRFTAPDRWRLGWGEQWEEAGSVEARTLRRLLRAARGAR